MDGSGSKCEVIYTVQGLSEADFRALAPYMTEQTFLAGEIILRQGTRRGHFHVIQSGTVHIYLEGEPRVRVATLGPGQFVGEMSCLTGEPVSATVEAATETVTQSVGPEELLELMEVSAALRRRITHDLINRINRSNHLVQEEQIRSAAVVQAVQRDGAWRYGELTGKSPAMAAVREQVRRLAAEGRPVVVLGEPGTGKEHVAARLHYEGPRHNRLLRIVPPSVDLSRDGVRQELQVAAGGTLVIKDAERLAPDVLHALLHDEGETRILFTAQELHLPGVESIHLPPLRERNEDIPELVRGFLRQAGAKDPSALMPGETIRRLLMYPFLAGNVKELQKVVQDALVLSDGGVIRPEHLRFGTFRPKASRPVIGLALGSGSARGACHAGVFKALAEESIPVDVIAGSSAGAIFGGIYAAGATMADFERVVPALQWRDIVRLTLSRQGLLENSPLERSLERWIGPTKSFADLKIPFTAVATDAATGRAVVMREGSLAMALRASSAIPGIMKPVRHAGMTLVDGALVHSVPVAVCRSMGADLVIAVDLGPTEFDPNASLLGALIQAFDITSTKMVTEELELADVVIRPGVSGGGSWKEARRFMQAGEEACRRQIPEIRRVLQAMAAQ